MFGCAAGLGLALLLSGISFGQAQAAEEGAPAMKVTRFAENPIIRPDMDPKIGRNINGPSLVRVPDWVEKPLGQYYLYFGNHGGKYIRMAYADDLHGPWTVYSPGVLQLSETACTDHIASPDMLVDNEKQEFLMFFHGKTKAGQLTFLARSKDGLAWTADTVPLGPAYFRVFEHDGWIYALAGALGRPGTVLMRSKEMAAPFEEGPYFLPRSRHTAVLKRGDKLLVFFSQGNDTPERIMVLEINMQGDWKEWQPSEPVTVLEPEEAYEGAGLPLEESEFGKINKRVRQLRDPAIFEEDGKLYLLYSVAGESGIGIAELTIP
jgi:hypothetical protein